MSAHILETLAPRQGRRAVILCDGPAPSTATLRACLGKDDLFICTDGAGRSFTDLPRRPDVVIGDFDTLGTPPADDAVTRYIHDTDQNTTDSEKAVSYAAQQGCVDAVLLGALGGLFDHSLSNAALPERFSWLLNVVFVSDLDVTVRVAGGDKVAWNLPTDAVVSLTPTGLGARGVDLQGVRWPLAAADLSWAGSSTISNHVATSPVTLTVTDGSLLASVRLNGTS